MENGNNSSPKMNKKKMMIIVAALAVVVVIALVVLLTNKKGAENNEPVAPANENTEQSTEVTGVDGTPAEVVPLEEKDGAKAQVPGGSLVTKDNKVITTEGIVTENNAVPASPTAPKQTPVIPKESLPASVTKLDVSATGFSPNSFEVKAGAPVTLAVTSADRSTHVFFFDDASLSAVAIGIDPGTTRAITFNAPSKAGEYTFRCDVPGHAQRGETGKMIVK